VIATLAYLLLLVATGYTLLGLLLPGRYRVSELAGFSVLLGIAATGLLLLVASLAGHAPSRSTLAVQAIGCLGLQRLGAGRGRLARLAPRGDAAGGVPGIALALCALPAAAAFWVCAGLPAEWDGFAIWLLKARVLAAEPLLPRPAYFSDLALGYSHLDYPPLLPLLVAGAMNAGAGVDPLLLHAVSALVHLGLAAALYGAVSARLHPLPAALLSAVLLGAPAYLRWAIAPLADLPLAAFHLCSLVFLCRALEDPRPGNPVLAAVFAAAAALTKLEGLPLAAIVTLALFTIAARRPARPARSAAWRFAGLLLLFCLPWQVYALGLPRIHEDYGGRLQIATILAGLPRIGDAILPALGAQALDLQRWGGLWLLAPVLAVAGRAAFRDPATVLLWSVCGAHLALYVLAYVITPWDLRVLVPMTLERLLLHLAPVAVLLAGLHAACLAGPLQRDARGASA
jgi:hypothetical protein